MRLLLAAALLFGGLYLLGYRPAELKQAAHNVSDAGASGISPNGGGESDWGETE
ncbi:hypothetical protein ACWPMX_01530 [Tsuneonella sp. HG094]